MKAEVTPGTAPAQATGASTGPEDRERERARIREGVWYCLKVFLALRLGLFLLALIGVAILPHAILPVSVPGWKAPGFTPGPHNLFTAWERQDALWFLRIATQGYRLNDGSAAFFPLYPLAIRAVSFVLFDHPLAASIVVSNAAFLGGLVVLYFLTSSELSEPAARKAVLYLAVFPTSFFFLAPYSESLFLLLSVTSFWAARRGKWPLAGVTGALAALTRNLGLLLLPALALEAWNQWRDRKGASGRDRGRALAWSLLWSGFVGIGTAAYLAYWQWFAGDWLRPITNQGLWQRVASLPWNTLGQATRDAYQYIGAYPGGYHELDWVIVVPALAVAVYAGARLRPTYGFYAWASILVPLCFSFLGRPLMSVPRFLLVLFPIFWGLALLAERKRIPHHLIVAASAAGLGLLTVLFVNWYYIF
ncbi:MAG: hypothetical protein M3Q23_17660 [Actinomycetota bacterium]|nr:hypothetical protein [Actinomycetota bacterium]